MTIAVPKVPNWYDNIPEQGVLCWCKVYDDHAPQLRIIVRKQSCMPFKDIIGDNFNYAKPATAEELRGFLLESVFESLQERRNLAHNVFTEVSTNLTHKTGEIINDNETITTCNHINHNNRLYICRQASI